MDRCFAFPYPRISLRIMSVGLAHTARGRAQPSQPRGPLCARGHGAAPADRLRRSCGPLLTHAAPPTGHSSFCRRRRREQKRNRERERAGSRNWNWNWNRHWNAARLGRVESGGGRLGREAARGPRAQVESVLLVLHFLVVGVGHSASPPAAATGEAGRRTQSRARHPH